MFYTVFCGNKRDFTFSVAQLDTLINNVSKVSDFQASILDNQFFDFVDDRLLDSLFEQLIHRNLFRNCSAN